MTLEEAEAAHKAALQASDIADEAYWAEELALFPNEAVMARWEEAESEFQRTFREVHVLRSIKARGLG